jgi:hypothetical protein
MAQAHAKGSSWFKYKPGFERGNDIRNAGMLLERVMMLYQVTWDPRYLAIAKDLAAAFVPLDTPEKVAKAEINGPNSWFHQASTWAYQGMWFYDRVANDDAFRRTLRLFIERSRDYTAGFPGTGNLRAYTYGWLLTQDPLYLDLGRAAWDDMVSRGITPWQFLPSGKQELSPMPGFLGIMASAPPQWREKNLPTHKQGRILTWRYFAWNNNPHMQGTRAFFREESDQPWSFVVATNSGGTFALYRPDGSIGMTRAMDEKTLHWARFEVPSDGQSGDYMLMCVEPSLSIKTSRSIEYQAYARVVDSRLPVVVQAAGPSQDSPVTGRALYFLVGPGEPPPAVSVGPMDPQRMAALFSTKGAWFESTQGHVPRQGRHYRWPLPPDLRGQVVGLGLSLSDDTYFMPYSSRPRYVRLEGIPPFVSANEKDLFVPNLPARLEPYQPASQGPALP